MRKRLGKVFSLLTLKNCNYLDNYDNSVMYSSVEDECTGGSLLEDSKRKKTLITCLMISGMNQYIQDSENRL